LDAGCLFRLCDSDFGITPVDIIIIIISILVPHYTRSDLPRTSQLQSVHS
jgi:hypothetical protein